MQSKAKKIRMTTGKAIAVEEPLKHRGRVFLLIKGQNEINLKETKKICVKWYNVLKNYFTLHPESQTN